MTGEDRPVLEELLAAQARREPVALAVIIRDHGSVPRHAGTKMLVYGDGRTLGTIGGGEMEARVVAAAAEALRDGRTRLVPYSLVDPQRANPFGPPPLDEAQVIGIIDDLRQVGVFVIDADREVVGHHGAYSVAGAE